MQQFLLDFLFDTHAGLNVILLAWMYVQMKMKMKMKMKMMIKMEMKIR